MALYMSNKQEAQCKIEELWHADYACCILFAYVVLLIGFDFKILFDTKTIRIANARRMFLGQEEHGGHRSGRGRYYDGMFETYQNFICNCNGQDSYRVLMYDAFTIAHTLDCHTGTG
ncbi:hypothetical protein A0H81_08284 [Grifola frondosa]|uniref:Uncharacterized protein n=1 Tax=Grifola frondosa TaxID=5627 RepID=A0A1C7M522_GRIFR|nr:hypothetical protein A0H81_08284 [Grifola frondosa]